jgi:hypothetical protein
MTSELFERVGSMSRAQAAQLERTLRTEIDDRLRVTWQPACTIVSCPSEYADGWHREAMAKVRQMAADVARRGGCKSSSKG